MAGAEEKKDEAGEGAAMETVNLAQRRPLYKLVPRMALKEKYSMVKVW